MNEDQATPTPGTAAGMTQTEAAVSFINKTVLNPSVTPITGTAKPLVDQAAAMMVQDMQSFLQGNEQILTVGIGKAIAYALDTTDPEKQKTGTKALATFKDVLSALNTFSTDIGKSAAAISSEFDKSK